MKRNILITGANGYIGKHLVQMLNKSNLNYNIFTLDKDGDVNFNIDVTDGLEVARVGRYLNFDTVVHLAALVRMNESTKIPSKYYETNIIGTSNLMELINFDNFIFASTGAAENPINPYSLSKLAAEDVVRQYAETYTIFRFYNVIGVNGIAPTNPDGLMYNLINAIKTGSFTLYGIDYRNESPDGTALREYVHVCDICRAIIKAIDKPAKRIENLAYGEPKTVLQIVNKFKEVNGVNFDVIPVSRRVGDLESMYLMNPSSYMERNYSFEQLLKINNDDETN